MSVTVKLYRNTTYITSVSNSGVGPTVDANKTVTLPHSMYRIDVYGETSTHTPFDSFEIII